MDLFFPEPPDPVRLAPSDPKNRGPVQNLCLKMITPLRSCYFIIIAITYTVFNIVSRRRRRIRDICPTVQTHLGRMVLIAVLALSVVGMPIHH